MAWKSRECIPYRNLNPLTHLDCDCIVTTERILKADFPIIYISMALSEREMRKIEEGIKEIQVNHLLELNILEAIILPIEEKNMESASKSNGTATFRKKIL